MVFAPGNLSEDGHGFVEHQWEYGGLFGWGTGDRPTDTTDDWHSYVRFVDWGKNVEGGWRTLTADEWHYLLFERKDAEDKRSVGTVDGRHGLLLLPDVTGINKVESEASARKVLDRSRVIITDGKGNSYDLNGRTALKR